MARATTADDGDVGFVICFGTAKDDFVLFVKGERRIGDGQGAKGLDDQGEGIGKKVFCYSISAFVLIHAQVKTLTGHGRYVSELGNILNRQ